MPAEMSISALMSTGVAPNPERKPRLDRPLALALALVARRCLEPGPPMIFGLV
jgi:hypothetical protein